jgi:Flp pilus assembly protein TadG
MSAADKGVTDPSMHRSRITTHSPPHAHETWSFRSAKDRRFRQLGQSFRCKKGVAALEFALLATPLMLITFSAIATCLALDTMSAMQGAAQYGALMVATGQAENLTSGPVSTTNTTATAKCSGSISSLDAEYYACQGLPSWATFTVTTTENCATPSVTVSLSVKASQAALAYIFGIFGSSDLMSNAVVMKEGTCP